MLTKYCSEWYSIYKTFKTVWGDSSSIFVLWLSKHFVKFKPQ